MPVGRLARSPVGRSASSGSGSRRRRLSCKPRPPRHGRPPPPPVSLRAAQPSCVDCPHPEPSTRKSAALVQRIDLTRHFTWFVARVTPILTPSRTVPLCCLRQWRILCSTGNAINSSSECGAAGESAECTRLSGHSSGGRFDPSAGPGGPALPPGGGRCRPECLRGGAQHVLQL